ncbi:Senescence regulator S40 protein [Actinidia chinensis var. chinensis]|uniref:Senescence regulator S40 protein n=1 Tax=Actinidia chinensis var. chinensis TaxID=1590841 RepID=A0A2R6PKJ6_ACTCC|nr:Senescence regulator S40 protein [Actinidia chinensis var. chinensis]
MAARRSYLDRPNYLYFQEDERVNPPNPSNTQFEFDESELWSSNEFPAKESKNPIPSSRPKPARKSSAADSQRRTASSSVPVDIPDWSKILHDGREDRQNRRRENEEADDDDSDARVPPHEYLARRRTSSFSMHEGVGRTLKGRDLSRVRNAIWKQIGFED